MYSTIVDNTPIIQVAAGKHTAIYALNVSQMNPLEAFCRCGWRAVPSEVQDRSPLSGALLRREKARILEAIAQCAVKEVVRDGAKVEFSVVEV